MTQPLKTVLLVEDNPDIRAVAKSALEMLGGLQVRACESGREALAALEAFRPQLVLLDVMMPEMDGPGVLKRMREHPDTAGIPVVFLTAKATTDEVKKLRALGAVDVLTKPFDPMTLHEKVKQAWQASSR